MGISRRKALGLFGSGAVLAATAGTNNARSASGTGKKPTSIAIIGGGISGLSVAYYLVRCGFSGTITVVEKCPTLGGNAATAEVILGKDYRGAGLLSDFVRFADLGVNDVNLQSYKKLSDAMDHINYSTDENLLPLEDTVAHFTPDFSEIWTKDGYLTGEAQPYIDTPIDDRRGIVDIQHSLHMADPQLARDEHEFMTWAAKDFSRSGNDHLMPPDTTVAEYVKYFRDTRLERTGITEENLDRLVRLFLYPRISAMYFADEAGPQDMPMHGVMSYYILQEGIGFEQDDKRLQVDRRYFRYGSQHWIDELARWLENQLNKNVKVDIIRGFEAAVAGDGNKGVRVVDISDQNRSFVVDQVVMAGHADHQLKAFKDVDSADPLLSKAMEENLQNVRHSISKAYAHTWNRLLPPDSGSWRTYNVMIREKSDNRFPQIRYQMTYVQNRHRNDRKNNDYNQYGMPEYFVSLNPQQDIPPEYILRRTEKSRDEALKKQQGYGTELCAGDPELELATATFRHTVMTTQLLRIQQDLDDYQGMAEQRVFFAGCWTRGAGLHEECFAQAEHVVGKILGTECKLVPE